MTHLLKTNVGRLRIIAFFEGLSLLILVFVAVPMKYFYGNTSVSKSLGPVHGGLFLLYLLFTIIIAIQQRWKLTNPTPWKIVIASFIPFGTFYIDHTILKKIDAGK